MRELLISMLEFSAALGACGWCTCISADHFWYRRPVRGIAWLVSGWLLFLVGLAYFVTRGGAR